MKISNLVANHLLEHRKGLPVFVFVEIWRRLILEQNLIKGQEFSKEGIMQQLPKQSISNWLRWSLLDKAPERPQILL